VSVLTITRGNKTISEWVDDGTLDSQDIWGSRLNQILEKMEDRDFFKGSSKGRALTCALYASILSEHYFDDDLWGKIEDALPVLTRCLKDGTDGQATLPALRSVSATMITCGDESGSWFANMKDVLKGCVYDAAIHALGAATYFGGADYQEVQAIMDLFIGIVDSSGDSIEAQGKPNVITAALQEWGFLSTLIEERGRRLSRVLKTFEDQLDNPSPEVLIATAENIALVYEQCYSLRTPEDPSSDGEDDHGIKDTEEEEAMVSRQYRRINWTKTHEIDGDDYSLKSKLKELSKGTMRYVKKDARKEVHSIFRDVAHAVEYPWRGPRYSTAVDQGALLYYGHRLRQNGNSVDRWWKLHRFAAIKRTLQDGSIEHLTSNPNVSDALRNCMEAPSRFIDSSDLGKALLVEGQLRIDEDIMSQPDADEPTDDDSDSDGSLRRRMRAAKLR
jgi:hypothetical protein